MFFKLAQKEKTCQALCERFCFFGSECDSNGWEDSDNNFDTSTDTGDHEPFP